MLLVHSSVLALNQLKRQEPYACLVQPEVYCARARSFVSPQLCTESPHFVCFALLHRRKAGWRYFSLV